MSSARTFASNCTIPLEGVNFVSAPNIRGTLNILWTCLSILLLCTYKILHLNVPLQSVPGNKKEHYYQLCFRLLDKAGWMLVNLVAPELVIAKAWCDNKSVDLVHDKLEELAKKDGAPWTRKHTHLANMGGFSIKFNVKQDEAIQTLDDEGGQGASTQNFEPLHDIRELPLPSNNRDDLSGAQDNTQIATNTTEVDVELAYPNSSHSESVNMELRQVDEILAVLKEAACEDAPLSVGTLQQMLKKRSGYVGNIDWKVDPFNLHLVKEALSSLKKDNFTAGEWRHFLEVWPSWYRNLRSLQGDVWILDAHQLYLARKLGIIQQLPMVAEADIGDRNKNDIFVFAVALWQIGWFVTQLIVRLCGRKSTSQLEIMTLSFAVVIAYTYYLLKDTPKDITYSIILSAEQHPRTKEDLILLAIRGPYLFLPRILTLKVLLPPHANPHPKQFARLPAIIRPFFAWCETNSEVHLSKRLTTVISDYIGTLGISNFDFHVYDNLESQHADHSFDAISVGFAALVVFSAVDFIAWNFSFPTPAEKQLWRICSILGLVAPLYSMLHGNYWPRWLKQAFPGPMLSISTLLEMPHQEGAILTGSLFYYLFARSFILVEVFRSLAYLPPDAFETSWPANLPHIG